MDWQRQDLQISTPSSMFGIFLCRDAWQLVPLPPETTPGELQIGAAKTNGAAMPSATTRFDIPAFSAWARRCKAA
ncbi:hypothetical protein TNCV_3979421 [Trichonephila clavipes]|nr:hypothetical protein TNCV_3979421 [Trichonephila clavipes]